MTKKLKHYKKDNVWIREHFEELVDKYGGCYVAVAKEHVTGVGRTAVEAEQQSFRECPYVLPSVIQVPSPQEIHANC